MSYRLHIYGLGGLEWLHRKWVIGCVHKKIGQTRLIVCSGVRPVSCKG